MLWKPEQDKRRSAIEFRNQGRNKEEVSPERGAVVLWEVGNPFFRESESAPVCWCHRSELYIRELFIPEA